MEDGYETSETEDEDSREVSVASKFTTKTPEDAKFKFRHKKPDKNPNRFGESTIETRRDLLQQLRDKKIILYTLKGSPYKTVPSWKRLKMLGSLVDLAKIKSFNRHEVLLHIERSYMQQFDNKH